MSDNNQVKLFEILATVAEIGIDEVSSEATLHSLGLNSIDITEILFEIEEVFGIEFPEQATMNQRFKTIERVADLANIVEILMAEQGKV